MSIAIPWRRSFSLYVIFEVVVIAVRRRELRAHFYAVSPRFSVPFVGFFLRSPRFPFGIHTIVRSSVVSVSRFRGDLVVAAPVAAASVRFCDGFLVVSLLGLYCFGACRRGGTLFDLAPRCPSVIRGAAFLLPPKWGLSKAGRWCFCRGVLVIAFRRSYFRIAPHRRFQLLRWFRTLL